MKKLNKAFVSSVLTKTNEVKHFLGLYLSLDKIKSAEDICRIDIILPAMEAILNERYLHNCNDDLKELYSHCNEFLQEDLKYLLEAAAEQNNKCVYKKINIM